MKNVIGRPKFELYEEIPENAQQTRYNRGQIIKANERISKILTPNRTDCFRLPPQLVYGDRYQELDNAPTQIIVVDNLPPTGEKWYDNNDTYRYYLSLFDTQLYAYVDDTTRWITAEDALMTKGYRFSFKGVFDKLSEDIDLAPLEMAVIYDQNWYYDDEEGRRIKVEELQGGGQAIIDVPALPSNADEHVLYRVTTATSVFNGQLNAADNIPVHSFVVDELPEDGILYWVEGTDYYTLYLCLSDGKAYGYLGDDGLTHFGSKWVEAHTILNAYYQTNIFSWGGIIPTVELATEQNKLYAILHEPTLHHYKNGWHLVCSENSNSGGNTGGGQAIIDVDVLPTENINEQAFYRVQTAQLVNAALESEGLSANIIVVPEKPETGVSAMNIETGAITGYLNLSDSKLYGYVDGTLRATMISMGLTEFVLDTYITYGWVELHRLLEMLFTLSEPTGLFSWGGIIQSRDEAIDETTFYVLLGLGLFHYKDGWHPVSDDKKESASSDGSVGEPSIILAGHRYYGEKGKLALRNLTGVTRIDWGDGTVEDFDEGSAEDIYTHQWHVNEDVQLPSGFEIRIFGCTKIGDSAFRVQDALNDLGNQYITTIIIRSGIEDIGSKINTGYVTDNQVTVIMDRYSPPHIVSDTSSSNSFDENVTKIIVPDKSVIADYDKYWNYDYTSILTYPFTDISDILDRLPIYMGEAVDE